MYLMQIFGIMMPMRPVRPAAWRHQERRCDPSQNALGCERRQNEHLPDSHCCRHACGRDFVGWQN